MQMEGGLKIEGIKKTKSYDSIKYMFKKVNQ